MRSPKGLIFSGQMLLFATFAIGAGLALGACDGIIGTRDITFSADASATSTTTTANTCVANLQTDKANCGACGQDCTNGNCAAGVCTLVDQQFGANGIDIDLTSGTLYIAEEDGHVVSCATNGCAGGATVLYKAKIDPNISPDTAESSPTRIHFSNGTVYFSNNQDNQPLDSLIATTGVYSLAGSTPTRVTPTNQSGVFEFNISGGALYWGSNLGGDQGEPAEGTFTCTLANCTATDTTIDKTVDLYDSMFLPNGAFVWASDGGVHYCDQPPACAGASVIYDPGAPNAWPQAVAYDAKTNLILISVGHSTAQGTDIVVSCPASDAPCNPTNVATGLYLPRGLAASNGIVYVAETGTIDETGNTTPSDGKVEKYPLNADGSGGAATVIASGLFAPNRIILDANSIYWTNEGAFGDTSQPGSIMKAPR